MAVTSIHSIKTTLVKSIQYIIDGNKTRNGEFVISSGCVSDAQGAAEQFAQVSRFGTGRSKVLAQHIIQSFKPDEITPEDAQRVGMELCRKLLGSNYQYILATHFDHDHIHNHIIFNNINMMTGRTFETEFNQGKKSERAWAKVRKISDELCEKYCLSVIKNPERNKGKSHYEWDMSRQNLSWKAKLKLAIDNAIMESDNFADFLEKCQLKNIEFIYKPANKIDLKFRLRGQQRFTRSRTLGWYYETPQIIRRIENYRLYREGKFKARFKSRLIDTSTEKMQESQALRNWAIIQNMKQASEIINALTSLEIQSPEQISEYLITQGTIMLGLTGKLNKLSSQIENKNSRIRAVENYQRWLPFYQEYCNTSSLFQKRYEKKYSLELERFDTAKKVLYRFYPDGHAPTVNVLKKQLDKLTEERDNLNQQYMETKNAAGKVEAYRQQIEKYLNQNRDVQRTSRSKKNELE